MKNAFGKYAVIDAVTHNFEQEPDLWWKINPPTSGDELAISKYLVSGRVVTDADGERREYPPTSTEIMHREVALLFGGTNIPLDPDKPVAEGGAPYIDAKMAVEIIEAKIRDMPHKMVIEIWEAIADAVPGWGPMRPKGRKSSKD